MAEISIMCILEDTASPGSPLRNEHGLAFLVESAGRRLLFDTGQTSGTLGHNLNLLGVDPATIDALAISHGHYDHTGGLSALIPLLRPGTPLYANPDLFRERFADREGRIERIGPSVEREEVETHLDLKLSAAPQQTIPGVWTTGEIVERPEAQGSSASHLMRDGDHLVADRYRDDLSLVIELGDHLALLCGCCHAGLLNTLAHVDQAFDRPISVIAGGLHLGGVADQGLQRIVKELSAMPALKAVYPNHCTGRAPTDLLARTLGANVVHACPTGTRFTLQG
ncbi:MAG: MBL fold metallo-hydrolase [Anaerolineae bacterium]|nr:MBL fold metallo-hydrolase [Anaerolineae bacterium]